MSGPFASEYTGRPLQERGKRILIATAFPSSRPSCGSSHSCPLLIGGTANWYPTPGSVRMHAWCRGSRSIVRRVGEQDRRSGEGGDSPAERRWCRLAKERRDRLHVEHEAEEQDFDADTDEQ